jgi:hypothetical protein
MRTNIATYSEYQVFLNYPFDDESQDVSLSMHLAVIAAGLLPICAHDLTAPDRPRLEMLVQAITNCKYSAHDFSRFKGEGERNFARFNMPVEMGMALFHALHSHRVEHRCAFFVSSPHDYRAFASDLAGLDPLNYRDSAELLTRTYEWLRDAVNAAFIPRPTAEIQDVHARFYERLPFVRGSGQGGRASHHEAQELMFQMCSEAGLWDWRGNAAGRIAFPTTPLSWIEA